MNPPWHTWCLWKWIIESGSSRSRLVMKGQESYNKYVYSYDSEILINVVGWINKKNKSRLRKYIYIYSERERSTWVCVTAPPHTYNYQLPMDATGEKKKAKPFKLKTRCNWKTFFSFGRARTEQRLRMGNTIHVLVAVWINFATVEVVIESAIWQRGGHKTRFKGFMSGMTCSCIRTLSRCSCGNGRNFSTVIIGARELLPFHKNIYI